MDEREKLARHAAFWHGQQKISDNQTLAAIKGYGSWGHSAELYADKHWREYTAVADMILAELLQETERCATIADYNHAHRTAAQIRRRPA